MTELVVKARVREQLEETNVSSGFYQALDEEVEELVNRAQERAEGNNRSTVLPRDV